MRLDEGPACSAPVCWLLEFQLSSNHRHDRLQHEGNVIATIPAVGVEFDVLFVGVAFAKVVVCCLQTTT